MGNHGLGMDRNLSKPIEIDIRFKGMNIHLLLWGERKATHLLWFQLEPWRSFCEKTHGMEMFWHTDLDLHFLQGHTWSILWVTFSMSNWFKLCPLDSGTGYHGTGYSLFRPKQYEAGTGGEHAQNHSKSRWLVAQKISFDDSHCLTSNVHAWRGHF